MKNFIIALLTLVFIVPATMAQESVTEKLFEKYSGEDGFTTVHITKELFSMIAQMNFEEGEKAEELNEMKDAMANLEFIRIVMFEDGDASNKTFLAFKEDLEEFDLDGFKELMVVKEKDENIRFVARQDGDIFKEFLILIDSKDKAGFISIFGDMDMETISKVSHQMGIEQMGSFGGHDHDEE